MLLACEKCDITYNAKLEKCPVCGERFEFTDTDEEAAIEKLAVLACRLLKNFSADRVSRFLIEQFGITEPEARVITRIAGAKLVRKNRKVGLSLIWCGIPLVVCSSISIQLGFPLQYGVEVGLLLTGAGMLMAIFGMNYKFHPDE